MQVSVEKTSELNRKMTVSIPEDVVQEKMEARFKSLAREIKLDGFRPGKVPVSVVKKQFGDRVRGEIAGDLIQNTYFDALQEQKIVPAGQPHIHPSEQTEGLEYIAEFEVYPEISLDGIDALEVTRTNASVESDDLEQMITKLREQKKVWNQVERAIVDKDQVTINFAGESEGENFTDGTVNDFQVEIGAKKMIAGFEGELVGLSAGDKKTFEVTFPEDYTNNKLAGKPATFDIEVTKVEEPALPDIDEEFIKAYGVESGEMESFRSDVKSNMERELELGLKSWLKKSVMDAIFANMKITVPKSLVDQEVEEMIKPYAERAKQQNISLEAMDISRDTFEEQATRRVTLGLVLGEIIKQNEIKADPEKVRVVVENMASSYEQPEDVINWYYADASRLQEVQQMVLEDEVVDWVVGQAKMTDKTVKFEEVMSANN